MRRPEIVQAIKKVLQRIAPDAEVILYDSEARGTAYGLPYFFLECLNQLKSRTTSTVG
ncbi:hypothetical protein SAMN05216365_1252 [Porphyromonadaceae bacterium NLAE-zl-C104]|nr:hypothetical protein SAMN05216331_11190 [Porphyromonadaceae bacterium KH3R12]SFS87359.1 hypothetical protein SAMN05216365_1252 [Porphyromonadaceae bacterium NLAE-zl-C104]